MAGDVPDEFSERDRAMIAYSVKLTRDPGSITSDDIAALRDHGLSDHAILEINLAAAYMNFVNRIALGLGVEIEEKMNKFTR